MKKIVLISIAIFCVSEIFGQVYFSEALKYSQVFPSGTARSSAMGGAFGALGGDLYSISINPAGLGLYRKSELVFTPSYSMMNTKATYYNSEKEDFSNNYNINNLGIVVSANSNKKDGFVSSSFGFAYNQVKNFNNNVLIDGNNNLSSLADKFVDDAWGEDPEALDAFAARLAFDAFLIDTVDGNYIANVPYNINQRKTIATGGSMGEMDFAFGTNFSNVLYLGASFTITRLRYEELTYHDEYDYENINDFNNFSYEYRNNTTGNGYGLKLGFIARPVEFLRFGAAFRFPTTYNLSEEYDAYLYSEFDNGDYYNVYPTNSDGSEIDFGAFDYKLVTPFKTTGSLAFQFGKIGLLSIDADYINYAKTRLRNGSYGYEFQEDNDEIQSSLGKVLNIRAGGEIRFDKVSTRVGFAYYPSPYKDNELNEKSSYTNITGGLGIRDKNFFIDLALVYSLHKEKYNLYNSFSEYSSEYNDNIASLDQNNFHVIATIGFRF